MATGGLESCGGYANSRSQRSSDWKRKDRKFKVFQVKEKFGGLRFYCDSSTDEIDALIRAAEEESTRTCDVCGRQGTARGGSWIRTRCDEHDDVNG